MQALQKHFFIMNFLGTHFETTWWTWYWNTSAMGFWRFKFRIKNWRKYKTIRKLYGWRRSSHKFENIAHPIIYSIFFFPVCLKIAVIFWSCRVFSTGFLLWCVLCFRQFLHFFYYYQWFLQLFFLYPVLTRHELFCFKKRFYFVFIYQRR